MKKIFLAMIFIVCAMAVNAQDAAAVVHAARNRISAKTVSTRSKMVITAKSGSTTERVIDQYSKDNTSGKSRKVIVFQSPASVAGTRFLTVENAQGANDQWIFLPSIAKVRRIAAAEGGGSFMGTDMSYDDIASLDRDVDKDTHSIAREENFSGAACYVIQSLPKDSSYQYSKMISWIDKSSKVLYKIEMYDKKGTLVKTLESSAFKDVQGRLTPMQMKISTIAAGTSTTVFTDIIKYDDEIPESVFTPKFLETGRP